MQSTTKKITLTLLGLFLSTIVIAQAVGVATDFLYDHQNSSLTGDNVQTAIDELFERSQAAATMGQGVTTNQCASGMGFIQGMNSCIDLQRTNNDFAASFQAANTICSNSGKRLCSAYELYAAKNQAGLLDTNQCSSVDNNNTEWSGSIYNGNVTTAMRSYIPSTGAACATSFTNGNILTSANVQYKVRCCQDLYNPRQQ